MSRTATPEAVLRNAGPVTGDRSVPGDKSISHRAAIVGAVASGTTRIANFAANRDCAATLACVRALGAVVREEAGAVHVEGTGRTGIAPAAAPLDVENSGTTIRLLTGLLAGVPTRVELTGDESVRRRPMERVAVPLRAMGADVETTAGRPPVVVRGRSRLAPIDHAPEQPSAQVKSAVLLAGLAADGITRVLEPTRTRDHTERMLPAFGAAAGTDERGAWVEGPAALSAVDVEVPGDFSSAAFLVAIALSLEGSDLTIRGVGLNPTRTRLLAILSDLGARIELSGERVAAGEPRGDIRVVYSGRLGLPGGRPLELGPRDVAEIVDEVPVLAVLGASVEGGVRFDGAGELRRKESDRLAALAEGLGRMGARVETAPDALAVSGPCRLRGARVRTWGDHRIAMAFACAAMSAEGETILEDPAVVGVSFPDFFGSFPPGAVRWSADVLG